jgi:putative transposase
MQEEIRRGRSVVHVLVVHLVFVTKYRRGVITDRVLEHIRNTCRGVCAKMGAELRELDGEDDHIHLLVGYPPKLSISRLVNSLKLVSARLLRKRDFPEVRRKLWGNHFWTPSYYAGSCGGASLQTVKRYIQDQRRPNLAHRRR